MQLLRDGKWRQDLDEMSYSELYGKTVGIVGLGNIGRWVGKIRAVSRHFTSGLEAMIREAELEEMEKKWREENERIMREHPQIEPPTIEPAPPVESADEPRLPLGDADKRELP